MNKINEISRIAYDKSIIHVTERGIPRQMWVEFCHGSNPQYLSLHRKPEYTIKELESLRELHGCKNAYLVGVGECHGLHVEFWKNPMPILFLYDWTRYQPAVAEEQDPQEHFHIFTVTP